MLKHTLFNSSSIPNRYLIISDISPEIMSTARMQWQISLIVKNLLKSIESKHVIILTHLWICPGYSPSIFNCVNLRPPTLCQSNVLSFLCCWTIHKTPSRHKDICFVFLEHSSVCCANAIRKHNFLNLSAVDLSLTGQIILFGKDPLFRKHLLIGNSLPYCHSPPTSFGERS